MKSGEIIISRQTERNFGIDALRIVSMFMIVVFHVLGDGGLLEAVAESPIKRGICLFLEMAVYCAVDCYALISGYVGLYSKYRYSNIITLWLRVVCYSFGITLVFKAFSIIDINYMGLLGQLFPVFSNKYWYFTAYFLLFLLIPVLNNAILSMSKKRLRTTLTVVIMFISVIYPVSQKLLGGDVWLLKDGFSPMWLVVLYLFGGYIRKYGFLEKIKRRWLIILYLFSVLFVWLSIWGIGLITTLIFGSSRFEYMWVSYFSIPILMEAVFLFLLFERMNCKFVKAKAITYLASLTFSVYLIHKHPLIQEYFITDKFGWIADYSPIIIVLIVLGVSIAIFFTGIAIDIFRDCIFRGLRINQSIRNIEEQIKNRIN